MNTVDYIGLIGSSTIAISFIPQTYKILHSGDVKSISTSFVIINIISSSMMCVYGIYYLIVPAIIANSSVCMNNIIILIYIINKHFFSENKI
jgi:uncharacterized protein with PQ loop repeat